MPGNEGNYTAGNLFRRSCQRGGGLSLRGEIATRNGTQDRRGRTEESSSAKEYPLFCRRGATRDGPRARVAVPFTARLRSASACSISRSSPSSRLSRFSLYFVATVSARHDGSDQLGWSVSVAVSRKRKVLLEPAACPRGTFPRSRTPNERRTEIFLSSRHFSSPFRLLCFQVK